MITINVQAKFQQKIVKGNNLYLVSIVDVLFNESNIYNTSIIDPLLIHVYTVLAKNIIVMS